MEPDVKTIEQEFEDFKFQHSLGFLRDKKEIQRLCTKIANELPIRFWGRQEAMPWGCIIDDPQEWYCDECPTQRMCPHPNKHWSK